MGRAKLSKSLHLSARARISRLSASEISLKLAADGAEISSKLAAVVSRPRTR